MDTPKENMPGVSPGTPPALGHAPVVAPVATPGLAGGTNTVPKKLFGGNVGKKQRADGLKAGSPEALAADRAAEAKRKRDDRAVKAAATPAPPLPAQAPPTVGAGQGEAAPLGVAQGGDFGPIDLGWSAEDLRDVSVQLVELGESWRVEAICRKCVEAQFPKKVVEEFSREAAFPPGSKRSLSTSLPGMLAKTFNALKVPLTLKSVITAVPALTYLVIRDFQLNAKLDKLVAADAERGKSLDLSKN